MDDVVRKLNYGIYHVDAPVGMHVARFSPIPAYKEKESFGDMDVLYDIGGTSFSTDVIQKVFSPTQTVVNGDCTSFDYKECQIDLIKAPKNAYQYALGYFSGSDCGNLVGKLARRFGMKHGHDGLFLPIRDGDNLVAELLLTNNINETYDFLKLDPVKPSEGFANLDDIFNFVASSPYYDPELYKLENLNTIAKTRDRKRETYRKFLEFGEKWTGPVAHMNPDKKSYTQDVIDFFDARDAFNETMRDLALIRAAKEIFSGEMVHELTGLTGKDLGIFIQYLKRKPEFKKEMIIYYGVDRISKYVLEYFDQFNKENS